MASNVGPVLLSDNQTGPHQQHCSRETGQGIGGMGCKLDKTKMETKSTDICAASKWHPIGGGGKPLVTLCCSFTKRRKPVRETSSSQDGHYLSMGDFSGLLWREIFYLLKNLIKPTFVPESWLPTGRLLLLHLMVALPRSPKPPPPGTPCLPSNYCNKRGKELTRRALSSILTNLIIYYACPGFNA